MCVVVNAMTGAATITLVASKVTLHVRRMASRRDRPTSATAEE